MFLTSISCVLDGGEVSLVVGLVQYGNGHLDFVLSH